MSEGELLGKSWCFPQVLTVLLVPKRKGPKPGGRGQPKTAPAEREEDLDLEQELRPRRNNKGAGNKNGGKGGNKRKSDLSEVSPDFPAAKKVKSPPQPATPTPAKPAKKKPAVKQTPVPVPSFSSAASTTPIVSSQAGTATGGDRMEVDEVAEKEAARSASQRRRREAR